MERIPVKVFDEFAAEGTRMSARSDLWRHAASVAAGPGWARAMAGATRTGPARLLQTLNCFVTAPSTLHCVMPPLADDVWRLWRE